MQPRLIQNYVVITTIQQGLVCGEKYLWWQGSRQPHGNFWNMNKSWFTVYEISSFSITHSVEYHEKLYLKYALLFMFFLYILTIQIKCANSWKWYMTKIILKHINHINMGHDTAYKLYLHVHVWDFSDLPQTAVWSCGQVLELALFCNLWHQIHPPSLCRLQSESQHLGFPLQNRKTVKK